MTPPAYNLAKARARDRSKSMVLAGQDIGAIPPVKEPLRRARADDDFRFFCESYFPRLFTLAWSEDHLKVIAKIEAAVIRLAAAMGDPGCLSLFQAGEGWDHQLLAEHLTAEYRVKTEARGRVVDEWKAKPGNPDNHWLDCLVGCAVAGSIQGAVLFGTDQREGARIKLSALQRGSR